MATGVERAPFDEAKWAETKRSERASWPINKKTISIKKKHGSSLGSFLLRRPIRYLLIMNIYDCGVVLVNSIAS